ncbi:MAG: family 2A encapsulin nanocompartment cargo protein cysteine desulfurase [Hyphomicrobium sp.]
MSTLDPGREGAPSQAASPGTEAVATFDAANTLASLPDPQVLTRLAEAMFAGSPGVGSTGGVSRPVPAEAAAAPSSEAIPLAIPLQGEALRALLEKLATPRSSAVPSFSIPGSSFYFLDGLKPSLPAARFPSTHSLGDVPLRIESIHPPLDVNAVRRDFPILGERLRGRPLIWLDNAATTQKPQFVIDRLVHFYQHENSNIHRGAHELAARATDAYEEAREKVRGFLNASSAEEIVFVRGATEAINLVAQSWGRQNIGEGDDIVITCLEHHANIVPWQQLCKETGARLRIVPVDDHGQVLLNAYEKLLGPRTRLVAFTQVSNALGTITPAREMVEMARQHGALVLVDGAQGVPHMAIDVQALDCDWYVFSGHKLFGPTGIGVLYGKAPVLESMPPWQGGGNMIRDVTFERTEYLPAPARFEAGTGNIADAVGLGAAIDYLQRVGIENVGRYEHELLVYATQRLSDIPGLRLIGTAPEKAAVLSFVLDGFRSEDIGAALDRDGIAVRAGHHCAQPILRRFGVESTVRPSFAFYNTFAEVDTLTAALQRIRTHSPRIG